MSRTQFAGVAFVLLALATWLWGGFGTAASGPEDVVRVSADDLDSGKVVVIGHLGSPLKTMLTIRGTWQHARSSKDSGPLFHVTYVNGKALDKPVIFHRAIVHVRYPRPWDKDDESKNGPTPSAGQSWEIRAYETGGFSGSPEEYQKELRRELPYLEAVPVWWRSFQVELHGVMQRPDARAKNIEQGKGDERN
jgi:hypothetical protein